MTKSLQFARPMMGRGAGFNTNDARRQLLEEWQNVAALERCERSAIAVLADTVEHNVEPIRQDTREVFALVVDRRTKVQLPHHHGDFHFA
jgi:hypothetical protein